jgi:hypothetical protein
MLLFTQTYPFTTITVIVIVFQLFYHEFTECLISVAICIAYFAWGLKASHLFFHSMKPNHPFCFLQISLEVMKYLNFFMLISYDLNYEKLSTVLSSSFLLIRNETFLKKNLQSVGGWAKLHYDQTRWCSAWSGMHSPHPHFSQYGAIPYLLSCFSSDKNTVSDAYWLERLFLALRRKVFCWKA